MAEPDNRRETLRDPHRVVGRDLRDSARDCLPVDVIIPAYNRADMIGRAVESALRQVPLPPARVIVVDDCSTDDTAEIAAGLGADVIRHRHNQGGGAARNTGIANATEDWIALLDSDDEWLPHLLSTLWPLRANHLLVSGAYLRCNSSSRDERHLYSGAITRQEETLLDPSSLVFPENYLSNSGVIVNRRALLEAGGYDTNLGRCQDLDLWLRVLEHGSGLAVPVPVVRYFLHDGQITSNQQKMWEAHRAISLRYQSKPWWKESALLSWEGGALYADLKAQLKRGRIFAAVKLLGRLVRSPLRIQGAVQITVRRRRAVRRSSWTDAWGRPRVVALDGQLEAVGRGEFVVADMRGRKLAGLALILRRPPAIVLSSRKGRRWLCRRLGAKYIVPSDLHNSDAQNP